MTKRLGAIRTKLIARMIEKKVRDTTGKHIRLMMRDVEIETKGNDVHISMKTEGFVDRNDYIEFSDHFDELKSKVDEYVKLDVHNFMVREHPSHHEVHISMELEGVVALKDFSVAAPFLGI